MGSIEACCEQIQLQKYLFANEQSDSSQYEVSKWPENDAFIAHKIKEMYTKIQVQEDNSEDSQQPKESDFKQVSFSQVKNKEAELNHVSSLFSNKIYKRKNKEEYYQGQCIISPIKKGESKASMSEGQPKEEHLQQQYLQERWVLLKPKGKGIFYVPGKIYYYGDFDGLPHGFGSMEYIRIGYVYNGQLVHGKASGLGVIKSNSPFFEFNGIWKNSQFLTGTITITLSPSACNFVELNNFPEGKSIINYHDGKKYTGYVSPSNFEPHGKGKVEMPDQSYYEGQFSDGQIHGRGIFRWKDGSCYEGHYESGKKSGAGKFTFSSKKWYEGEWENGKQHGKGTLYDSQGTILMKGIWSAGTFEK